MDEKLKIILADHHTVVLEGLRALLEREPGFEVVGMAANGEEVLNILKAGVAADVVLADIDMSVMNGTELAQHLNNTKSETKVIMLSMYDDDKHIAQALEAGAKGYLFNHSSIEEVIYALTHVHEEGAYICRALGEKLIQTFLRKVKTNQPVACGEFSEREKEILTLIADGYTNQEIADRIFSSRRTVEGHRLSLIEKTGTRNTASLVKYAITNGLVR